MSTTVRSYLLNSLTVGYIAAAAYWSYIAHDIALLAMALVTVMWITAEIRANRAERARDALERQIRDDAERRLVQLEADAARVLAGDAS